jgi:putative transcriptional regulator
MYSFFLNLVFPKCFPCCGTIFAYLLALLCQTDKAIGHTTENLIANMSRLPPQALNHAESNISLAGYLMVASPGIDDPIFSKSVCIVVEHSEQRTLGIVLNRRLSVKSAALWEELLNGEAEPVNPATYINFGGPLDGPVLAIHSHEQLAEGGNNQGVFLSAQTDTLRKLAMVVPNQCRLYVGNVLWKPSQLERAIVDGDWHVLPAIPEIVFADEQRMWRQSIQTVGNSIMAGFFGVGELMAEPERN